MREQIEVVRDGIGLSGSIWLPEVADPMATILMHPGSGPSNRDNNGYFPPIRSHFLSTGCAVASFDKRGVGESGGNWQRAGITTQADDLIACSDVVRRHPRLADVPFGIFGHSQGGWVVVEAAGRPYEVDFVIVNSGPGVTVWRQDRYAHARELEAAGASKEEIAAHLARFETLVELARDDSTYADVYRRSDLDPYLPIDEADWGLWKEIFDYDPVPAMARVEAPVLAIFGSDDVLVPVTESIEIFRANVDAELLRVEVFQGADHRMQVDGSISLVPGYLETITSFVAGALAS